MKMKYILLISTCKYSLHELEFINPIKNILEEESIQYLKIHISKLDEVKDIEKLSHIIICGTAIKDFSFKSFEMSHIFKEIEKLQIPTLGICAGAQIISTHKQIPLEYNFQSSVLEFKALNTLKILEIEKNEKVLGYALHSYCITLDSINNNAITLKNNITPILVNSINSKYVELAQVNKFTLCFFHIEIKNKKLLNKWIFNTC